MFARFLSVSLLALVVMLSSACQSSDRDTIVPTLPSDGGPIGPIITSHLITVDELPAEFDSTRTYSYLEAPVVEDAEKLILTLWDTGIRTRFAWEPLDNPICADPVGPRFTVELVGDEPRIAEFGFERGAGRLFCATILRMYEVSDIGLAS